MNAFARRWVDEVAGLCHPDDVVWCDGSEVERERRLEETRRQIEAETKRSLDLIRSEVADLTLEATARVTGKVLDAEDQRRLIDEAISELDFSALEKETT